MTFFFKTNQANQTDQYQLRLRISKYNPAFLKSWDHGQSNEIKLDLFIKERNGVRLQAKRNPMFGYFFELWINDFIAKLNCYVH